jgi:VWFA-related protein
VNDFWPRTIRPAKALLLNCLSRYFTCLLIALIADTGLGPVLSAQDKPADVAPDVRVVLLPVTVRDKKGQIVRDLKSDDFTLQEDGRPQVITRFEAAVTNLPLTLGLLVETSRSQDNVLEAERNASRSFLDQMLVQERDKAFLIHFDHEVELLQDVTSSHGKMQKALELLKTPSDRERANDPNDPANSPSKTDAQHGTQLYDAIYLASNELMKKQAGRKAIIILSDGVDRGSKTYLDGAIEAAQRADTMIYCIYFAEPRRDNRNDHDDQAGGNGRGGGGYPGGGGGGWPGGGGGGWPGGGSGGRGGRGGQRHPEEPRADGKVILKQISKETGGRFFETSKKQTVGEVYDSIVEELRTQYNIGYTPDKDSSPSGFHHVQVTTKDKELTVQTRDGYYPDR